MYEIGYEGGSKYHPLASKIDDNFLGGGGSAGRSITTIIVIVVVNIQISIVTCAVPMMGIMCSFMPTFWKVVDIGGTEASGTTTRCHKVNPIQRTVIEWGGWIWIEKAGKCLWCVDWKRICREVDIHVPSVRES